MSNKCRYLLDVANNTIEVNDHTILDHDNPVRNELVFQFLNPDHVQSIVFNNPKMLSAETILKKLQSGEKVVDTSYIRFFFPIGKDVGDFIDEQRGFLINFETESDDWSVAQGIIEGNYISFVVSCYNQKIIKTLFSVYFKCKNIQSYAPVGSTYVYADIQNVVGIEDVIKVFPIQKKLALPQINSFTSIKTTTSRDEAVTLKWQTSGVAEGQLNPGETNIFSLPTASLNVKVNRNIEYRLTVKGNNLERAESINLYLHPPRINRLDYDPATRMVKWDTQYSEAQQLAIGTSVTKVDAKGELEVASIPASPQLTLRTEGYLYAQVAALNLLGYTYSSTQLFRSWTSQYSQYSYTKWQWETKEISDVKLQITEDGTLWYDASTLSSGEFQYVSDQPILKAQLLGKQSDGTAFCLVLDGGES